MSYKEHEMSAILSGDHCVTHIYFDSLLALDNFTIDVHEPRWVVLLKFSTLKATKLQDTHIELGFCLFVFLGFALFDLGPFSCVIVDAILHDSLIPGR